jgi:hypothetical protein
MPEKKTTKKPAAKKSTPRKAVAEKKLPTLRKAVAEKEQPAHILLRLKSESGQTIAAHANVIARKGTALLGKMGRLGVSTEFMDVLNKQIDSGVKTFLFLAMRPGWNQPYVMYACQLRQVYDALDEAKRNLVPEYYYHEIPNIKTWFEISSIDRLPQEYTERIFVLSSERPITSALGGMNSVFRVGVQEKKK